jgi:hypothetical protein
MAVGKSWEFEYQRKNSLGHTVPHVVTANVEAWETVTVPAGAFRALRVAHKNRFLLRSRDGVFARYTYETYWYAPEVKRYVKRQIEERDDTGKLQSNWIEELIEYRVE